MALIDLERFKKEAMKSGNAEKLKELAGSDAARRIGQSGDAQKLKSAVQSGDEKAIGEIMQRVLGTPDGQRLLKTFEENFKKQ